MLFASELPSQLLPWLSSLTISQQTWGQVAAHGILSSSPQTQKQFFKKKKKKVDSKCNSLKKKWKNDEHIWMNETEAALNYSLLGAEADALAKFKMKLHIPPGPFLAITI